jgi:HSP20 family protein
MEEAMNELARWDPFKSVVPFGDSLFDVVPTLLRPATRAAWSGARMDVAENDKSYQLAIELPGMPKDSIQVSVYENTVSISGEAAAPQAADGHNWLLRERSYGKLTRNIQLPEAVDDSASEAKYVDGVLYLTLQKKRASQVKRLTVN